MLKNGSVLINVIGILELLIVIGLMFGWCMNVYKFFKLDFEEPFKAEILRGLSIPTGFGSIVGYIDIKD